MEKLDLAAVVTQVVIMVLNMITLNTAHNGCDNNAAKGRTDRLSTSRSEIVVPLSHACALTLQDHHATV